MRQATSRQLFGYWNSLRGARSAPERSLVDPIALRNIIGETFILEVDAAERFPVLIAGASCNALFTGPLRGRDFLSLWPAIEKDQIAALCTTVSDDCVPVVAGISAGPYQRPAATIEMLLLPLRHNGRTHARLLGSLQITTHPTWLGLLPVDAFHLISTRMVTSATPIEINPATMGAEASTPFVDQRANAPVKPGSRAYLRLVQGGKTT